MVAATSSNNAERERLIKDVGSFALRSAETPSEALRIFEQQFTIIHQAQTAKAHGPGQSKGVE